MQLSSFIVPIIMVIFWGVWEYTHNKATYDIKTALIRYGIVYAAVAFGFSYLFAWKYFQWVMLAAVTVLALLFFTVIAKFVTNTLRNWKLIKVMIPLILIVGMTSCSKYNDDITGTVSETVCNDRPADQTSMDSVTKAWLTAKLLPGGTTRYCLVSVKTDASWPQKIAIAKHDGTIWWVYILWPSAFSLFLFSYLKSNKGGTTTQVVAPVLIGIGLLAGGAAAVNWATTKEFTMPKAVYDNPDARHAYEDANLYL